MELMAKIVGVTHIKYMNSIQRFLSFFFFFFLQKGNGVDNRQNKKKLKSLSLPHFGLCLIDRSLPPNMANIFYP